MPVKLSPPVYTTKFLEYTDAQYECEGDPSFVVIKPARQHEHEKRQKIFDKITRQYSATVPDQVTLIQDLPLEDLKRTEVFLTLVECNLNDDDEKPLFPSKKDAKGNPYMSLSMDQFSKVWGTLPPDIANEIHRKVLEVNPMWSGNLGEAE